MLHRIVQTFAQNVGSHNPVTASQLGAIVPPPVQTAVSHMDVQSPGPQPAQQLCVAPQLSGVGPQSALPQGLGVHMVVVDVVVVVVVVVVVSQTWAAVHISSSGQVPQLSVKPVQSPSGIVPQSTPARQVVGVQQVPKSGFAFPGGEAGFMQLRLQQLMFV